GPGRPPARGCRTASAAGSPYAGSVTCLHIRCCNICCQPGTDSWPPGSRAPFDGHVHVHGWDGAEQPFRQAEKPGNRLLEAPPPGRGGGEPVIGPVAVQARLDDTCRAGMATGKLADDRALGPTPTPAPEGRLPRPERRVEVPGHRRPQ